MSQVAEYFPTRDLETMSAARNYIDWTLRRLVLPHLAARVLEIGAGIGNYSARILADPCVQSLTAIEIDPRCAEEWQRAFTSIDGDKKASLIGRDYMDVELAPGSFDSIVCLNVLEHIVDDVRAVQKAYDALTPGGRFVVYVPAFPLLLGAIDERLGHVRRYTKASATPLFRNAGFRLRAMRYYNFAGFFGWWIRFCVL